MSGLTLDMNDPSGVPYFLWSEGTTLAEFRRIIDSPEEPTRPIYLGRLLREARVADVWQFIKPSDVAEAWDEVSGFLGRKRPFWEYLLDVWRKHGSI